MGNRNDNYPAGLGVKSRAGPLLIIQLNRSPCEILVLVSHRAQN
jgi:hypothetical protein